jgi:hypothetical protein
LLSTELLLTNQRPSHDGGGESGLQPSLWCEMDGPTDCSELRASALVEMRDELDLRTERLATALSAQS